MRYDPDEDVDAAAWLAMDESEQQHLIRRYHKRAGIRMPSTRMHAIVHGAIESQLAEGEPVVTDAFSRMRAQGLSRHDAVHAVGSVWIRHVYEVLKNQQLFDKGTYDADMRSLTAEEWLRSADVEDE